MIYKCKYFNIKELVSPVVYNAWGERAWMFFDENILKELDYVRETYGKPIIINNWANGGNLKQCGLRSNMDDLVKSKKTLYLSAHIRGTAFDLHCKNGYNNQLWQHCYNLIINKKTKFNGLEDYKKTNGWVHIQRANTGSNIYIF